MSTMNANKPQQIPVSQHGECRAVRVCAGECARRITNQYDEQEALQGIVKVAIEITVETIRFRLMLSQQ